MELSPIAVARAGKVLEWSRAAPRPVLDTVVAAGDLIAATAVAAVRVGGYGLQ